MYFKVDALIKGFFGSLGRVGGDGGPFSNFFSHQILHLALNGAGGWGSEGI